MENKIMTLPNKITISRIFLIPIFLLFMVPLPSWTNNYSVLKEFNNFVYDYGNIVAVSIFIIASITDGLDGYIARRYNQVSNLGIFLDPIADKIMVISALTVLVEQNKLSSCVAIVIIAREFIVTAFRLIASDKNVVISANKSGKIKTVSQMALIVIALLTNNYIIMTIITVEVIFITVYSGFKYIYDNKNVLV